MEKQPKKLFIFIQCWLEFLTAYPECESPWTKEDIHERIPEVCKWQTAFMKLFAYRLLHQEIGEWRYKYMKDLKGTAAFQLAVKLSTQPLNELAEETGQGFLWDAFSLPEAVLWRDLVRTKHLWMHEKRKVKRNLKYVYLLLFFMS